jgi:hypothetical protein
MEAIAEEITVVKVSREISMEIALEEIVYYHPSLNKRSAIYIGSLDVN